MISVMVLHFHICKKLSQVAIVQVTLDSFRKLEKRSQMYHFIDWRKPARKCIMKREIMDLGQRLKLGS